MTPPLIHPSAIIHSKAELASNVSVGPYSVIEQGVSIDEGSIIASHVVINGQTHIGKNNHIYQFSSIGEVNQDKKYHNELTQTKIGDHNTIREGCSIHRGTIQDQGITTIGSHNLLMAYTHIAHDCHLKDHIIIANSSNLAGHVQVEEWAILGGFTAVHQFCKIGAHAFIGIRNTITQDVLPFVLFAENKPRSINHEGLKRRDFSSEDLLLLKQAYRMVFRRQLSLNDAVAHLLDLSSTSALIQKIIYFIQNSKRGLAR
jgi:UDP-N-acetylglucosamine acyltransferase